MFVSIVKISPLFWVPEMWSMIIGILSFTENRITEVFQKVECGEGFLSIFFSLFNFVCPVFSARCIKISTVILSRLGIMQWSCRQLEWSLERYWLVSLTSGLWFDRDLSWSKSSLLLNGERFNFPFLPSLQSHHFVFCMLSCWNLCCTDLALYPSRKLYFHCLVYCYMICLMERNLKSTQSSRNQLGSSAVITQPYVRAQIQPSQDKDSCEFHNHVLYTSSKCTTICFNDRISFCKYNSL